MQYIIASKFYIILYEKNKSLSLLTLKSASNKIIIQYAKYLILKYKK
jgi:hypothetical protein